MVRVCRRHRLLHQRRIYRKFSSKLNGFHNDIKFTYGIEKDGKLPFLDVLAIRKDYEIEATVYYKNTNNDVFTGSRFPQQHEN